MIASKFVARITAVVVLVSLLACGLIVYAANTFVIDDVPEYQEKLFGDEVLAVDIRIPAEEWSAMMDNAQ
ncbi:MAG: hypothetical protein LBR72_04265, partial [Oscillospiraceae bacterium]|nr:hypothetical protein [Oscillospiraceae bacterium]